MARMQRFVTYIYAYENGKKQQNTGFAKIEVRGNDGRMELHLRGAGVRKGECSVAFFTDDNGSILSFPIGKMRLTNGQGDFGTVFKADHIGNSPYHFINMEGIVIIGEDGSILLSRWKEGNSLAVVEGNIRIWKPEEVRQRPAEQTAVITGEEEKSIPVSQDVNASAAKKEEQAAEIPAEPEPPIRTESPVRTEISAEPEPPAEPEAPAEPELPAEPEASGEPNPPVSTNPPVTSETPSNNDMPGQQAERTNDYGNAKNAAAPVNAREDALIKEGIMLKTKPQNETPDSGCAEDIQATEVPMRNIFPRYNWLEIWERIKETHPAFRLDRNILCVRIELKDLREMPKKYWYLGNNSFLLHGFFNYRYLILGKMEEERWFIGVPGIYQHQERVMAAIFGFPEFLPINREKETGVFRRTEEPVNQFGCWYHTLEE